MNDIADKLKHLRERKGVSQADVAKAIGLTRTAYVKYESGVSKPSSSRLGILANYFGVSTDCLLGCEKSTSPMSNEEEKLLHDFKDLNKTNQQIILNTVAAFLTQQTSGVFENVINNNNGNGKFYVNNGDNCIMS